MRNNEFYWHTVGRFLNARVQTLRIASFLHLAISNVMINNIYGIGRKKTRISAKIAQVQSIGYAFKKQPTGSNCASMYMYNLQTSQLFLDSTVSLS